MAERFGITARQVQNLERIGLPHSGHRATKRYPLPEAEEWWEVYQRQVAKAKRRKRAVPFFTPQSAALEEELEVRQRAEARRRSEEHSRENIRLWKEGQKRAEEFRRRYGIELIPEKRRKSWWRR